MIKLPVTMHELIEQKPTTVWFSANTVWWTHHEKDLKPGPVPLDCFGSPLLMYDSPQSLKSLLDLPVIRVCPAYGIYPLTTFTCAHAQNLELIGKLYPAYFPNKLIDVRTFPALSMRIQKLVDDKMIPNLDVVGAH